MTRRTLGLKGSGNLFSQNEPQVSSGYPGKNRVLVVYFAFFPSGHTIGPATTISRLASYLTRHAQVEILTLNYNERIRRRLFEKPYHTVKHQDGYVVTYLPTDVRRYVELFKRLISALDAFLKSLPWVGTH